MLYPCCVCQNLTPYEFVESMKKKGIRVPGIGHRYGEIFTVSMFSDYARLETMEIFIKIMLLMAILQICMFETLVFCGKD